MSSVFRRIGAGIRNLSPSAIREIIVIVIILIISIFLSIPQFKEDREALRIWKETHMEAEAAQQAE
jgi:hypothetical protein